MSIIQFKDHRHNKTHPFFNLTNSFIKLIRFKILVYKILILDKQLISNNKILPYKFQLYLLNKVKYNKQYNRILYNNLIKIWHQLLIPTSLICLNKMFKK